VLGYSIGLPGGEIREVMSDEYEVADDGSIVFLGGGTEVDRFGPGGWIEVRSLGTRLSEVWPAEEIALVIDTVAERLGVGYGQYIHALRDVDRFGDWWLNDLDCLTTAVLDAIGVDPDSTERRREGRDVRNLIARGFSVEG
jgi:hypothetical protein